MIIQTAVTHNNFKNGMQISKNHLQFLATPTSITADAMALKILCRHYPLIIKDVL